MDDNSGWKALALYYWAEGISGPNWPGLSPAGPGNKRNSIHLFELPADLNGKSVNIIFNNNGAGAQFDGPYITIDKDYYFKISDSQYTIVTI